MVMPLRPPRADHWKLRTRTLAVGKLPLLMGIINVTPDSFSDGGHCFDAEAAVEHGLRLAAEGADILDVGGESTRPYAQPVDVQEELRRVMPVVGALCQQTGLPVSIDTSKALVARHAIHAGAEIINDVTALAGDPAMLPLAVETGCGVCVMHMQGTPQTMQDEPTYADVVAEVIVVSPRPPRRPAGRRQWPKTASPWTRASASARPPSTTCNCWPTRGSCTRWAARCWSAIRESVFWPADPAAGTIGVALSLARQGVQILRVHDVAAVRQALCSFRSTAGTIGVACRWPDSGCKFCVSTTWRLYVKRDVPGHRRTARRAAAVPLAASTTADVSNRR